MKKIVNLVILIVAVFIDLFSKHLVSTKMNERDSIAVIKDFFHITYVQNRGVAFGMFYGKINWIIVIGVIAVIGIGIYLIKNHKEFSMWTSIAMMLILAGAIGNLYDRVFRGFVVDFVDFRGIWQYIFNIADSYINIGAGMIILETLFKKNYNTELKEETK